MRYVFTVQGPKGNRGDDRGATLADDGAARAYGRRLACELKDGGGYDDVAWRMIVRAEDGRQVLSEPFWMAELTGSASFP